MKRRGAMPPIVTVIIVIAAVVAAALAAYFIYSTTARGVRQVMITVVGQPTLYAGQQQNTVELRVTFKNDGTADVDLTGSIIVVQDINKQAVQFNLTAVVGQTAQTGQTPTVKLAPGQSVSLIYTARGASLDRFPDGALATLQTRDGYQTSFAVAKP